MFIDKTFTVVADVLLKVFPSSRESKKSFLYYRQGLAAQSNGAYVEALENYSLALELEEDSFDRSYIFYNIGLIHGNNGAYEKALEYYNQALEANPQLPQALNNSAVIYHCQATKCVENNQYHLAQMNFTKAADFWKRALKIEPNNYIEARNWLNVTGNIVENR